MPVIIFIEPTMLKSLPVDAYNSKYNINFDSTLGVDIEGTVTLNFKCSPNFKYICINNIYTADDPYIYEIEYVNFMEVRHSTLSDDMKLGNIKHSITDIMCCYTGMGNGTGSINITRKLLPTTGAILPAIYTSGDTKKYLQDCDNVSKTFKCNMFSVNRIPFITSAGGNDQSNKTITFYVENNVDDNIIISDGCKANFIHEGSNSSSYAVYSTTEPNINTITVEYDGLYNSVIGWLDITFMTENTVIYNRHIYINISCEVDELVVIPG